ncbi:MAG: protoheme IX farnesyltransferase [Saprospiraceae bacterium]|nr:protoheme IX farnesyltransferase [Candidatus Defluviibacterium haderslevense]
MNQIKLSALGLKDVFRDIGILVKFKLSLMVVFSSVASYLIFAKGDFQWSVFSLLFVGGLFVTFAANALNQGLERDYDKLMERTVNRPIADGRMSLSMGVLISGIFCTLGVIALAAISTAAAALGMFSFVLYAFVYTPLKRYSTLAVPVGAIPGALPTLIAGVAAQNGFTIEALCLFGIQYLWQFPHFWAIAWLGHKDYMAAGFKLVKENAGKPDPSYGLYSAVYSLVSIVFLLPGLINGSIHLAILGLLVLTMIVYAWFGYRLYMNNDRNHARALMFCSIFYLPIVLILFIINNIVI